MVTVSKLDASESCTPSPEGTYGKSSVMGGNSREADVSSPFPASTSSTTSSEPSHSHCISSSSSGYLLSSSVPNPFATATAPSPGWGGRAYDTGAAPSPSTYPRPLYHPPLHPVPMVVSAPAPPSYHHPHHAWARENSCPNFSIGTTGPKSPGARGGKGSARRRSYSKSSTASSGTTESTETTAATGGLGESVNCRRQKRLERNRESARLSRRRRKQYLEILEDRVTQLSTEVDQGRKAHAAQAVTITLHKRREVLEAPEKTDEERVRLLEQGLGRTSAEMMLVSTFKYQQLKSFSLPPQSKFILWLTLQNDQYFRGGRAASERLSAARIGERMLNSGNDRVPPAQSMWPLFCNEVGLSYDQEERVRYFQRTMLQSPSSWLERHSARAADLAMAAVHDSTQAISLRLGQRERSMLNFLTSEQKVKFLLWTEKNRHKMQQRLQVKVAKDMPNSKNPFVDDRFKTDKQQHIAANLYIVNYRLQKLMQVIPRAAPLVTGAMVKKLSRRPSFESLGRSPMDKVGKDGDEQLSPSHSFASSGSLKRSSSTLSIDGDRPQLLQISPDDAEETCRPSVEKVLGYLREIIPPTQPVQYYGSPPPQQQVIELRIPSPTKVTSAPYQPQYVHHPVPTHLPVSQGPVPMNIVSSLDAKTHDSEAKAAKESGHKKQSSFIPPYLNVVPEEMFPNDGSADEFLMSLVDEDWAIGEGIDMDTTT